MHRCRRPGGAAALFEHARIRIGGSDAAHDAIDAARLLGIWKSLIVIHPDGTPRTKHVTTNPIVEIDEQTTIDSSASTANGGFPTATSRLSTWWATSATT